MSTKSGYLIALEGVDGSGKSTQLDLVGKKLKDRGYNVYITQQPSRGRIGKLLRVYLKDKNSTPQIDGLLFAADRVEHYFLEVEPRLKEGVIVLTDRYKASSIAYQGAHGADVNWLKQINSSVPEPDLSIYLELDLKESLARINQLPETDIEKFENLEFLNKVEKIYKSMMADDFIAIPAADSPDLIAERIVAIICNKLQI